MMGDKESARKSYQDFLTLWKDADPDIPIYKQAKAEYAKLNKQRASRNELRAGGVQRSAISARSTNITFAGRSPKRRMKYGNHSFPNGT